jgi:hypothetical protein
MRPKHKINNSEDFWNFHDKQTQKSRHGTGLSNHRLKQPPTLPLVFVCFTHLCFHYDLFTSLKLGLQKQILTHSGMFGLLNLLAIVNETGSWLRGLGSMRPYPDTDYLFY